MSKDVVVMESIRFVEKCRFGVGERVNGEVTEGPACRIGLEGTRTVD